MSPLDKLNYYRITGKVKRLVRRFYSSYQRSVEASMNRRRLSEMPGFNRLLERISSGAEVSSNDLLPYISQESLESRHWANLMLAEAFYGVGKYEQAKVFMRRVVTFAGPDEKYLPLLMKIHAACGDVPSIREAHKTLGLRAASEAKIVQALEHFNAWQYAYVTHNGIDEYHYDFEVLASIGMLAKPHSFPSKKPRPITGRKVRLAYLMFGMMHVNSVIVKNSLIFAKYHDAAVFDVAFFIPEQQSLILGRQESAGYVNEIKARGWDVVVAPNSISEEESLIDLARSIYAYDPDVLITNAALADMKHYFITSLRPAPLVIGLCQGRLHNISPPISIGVFRGQNTR